MSKALNHSPSTATVEHADEELNRPATIGDFIYGLLARYDAAVLLCLLILVVVYAFASGQHKPLWYDELFTLLVAKQRTWHEFSLAMPAEGNPPLNTLLTAVSIRLFGASNFAIRFAPLLGYLGALVGIFVFVRRECGAVFGLLAVILMFSQPAWKYSFEARPYGLLLGFLMLGMVSYQRTTEAADDPRPS